MSEPNPDNPTAEFAITLDDEEIKIVLEFHLSENAEDLIDVPAFVEMASSAVLVAMTGS